MPVMPHRRGCCVAGAAHAELPVVFAGNDPPGQANLAICSSAVGQRYKCLAFTLEMPFKDTSYAKEPMQVGLPFLSQQSCSFIVHLSWRHRGRTQVSEK